LYQRGEAVQIEAVSVCVGYGDFLAQVAPLNRPLLDRWIVVTSPKDDETREVCRKFTIECVTSDDGHREGPFSKGRLIERGFAFARGDGWLLHLDSDIVLPADLHQVLGDADIDPSCIHGCDRFNVHGWDAWQRLAARPLLVRSNAWAIHLNRADTTIGTRVANQHHGYTPIGFFQLFHGSDATWRGFPSKRYPHLHGTAARTDVQHALQWDRRKRVLIPELVVWHLESEPCKMGANWSGRKTARFGPPAKGATASQSYGVS
jgi:hypothetical protein